MAYFNELPNLEVVSRFPNQSSNQDYTIIKNLWRRAKLREDIANAITAFNYYQIKEGERPDQIAEKVYGDPELDWVILITNNITNFNEEWPLGNTEFYNYLIDKYGDESRLQEVHHTETKEQRDSYKRLVIPDGLQVDPKLENTNNFTTESNITEYEINSFLTLDENTDVKINLMQALNIKQNINGDTLYLIVDINFETSSYEVKTRDGNNINITINNDMQNTWPSGWGGTISILGRNSNITIECEDILNDTFEITLPNRLYEVTGTLKDGKIVPTFRFVYYPPS